MNSLESKILQLLEPLDEEVNVILGTDPRIPLAGNPHATVSQRVGQMILYGTMEQKQLAKEIDADLTYIQVHIFGQPVVKSHCLDALDDFPTTLPEAG